MNSVWAIGLLALTIGAAADSSRGSNREHPREDGQLLSGRRFLVRHAVNRAESPYQVHGM